MFDCGKAGSFPLPHSDTLSTPEFMQELYAKINECVDGVNECIQLVESSGNVVENWQKLKADCDMIMLQYANTMNEYANTIGDYTQQLVGLEERINALDTATSTLETLVEGYKSEVEQKTKEVLGEIAVMADSIIEVGSSSGWNWSKFKSGKVEATKELIYSGSQGSAIVYDGRYYTMTQDVVFPFAIKPGAMLWLQPQNTSASSVQYCSETYAKVKFRYTTDDFDPGRDFLVYARLEGYMSEET